MQFYYLHCSHHYHLFTLFLLFIEKLVKNRRKLVTNILSRFTNKPNDSLPSFQSHQHVLYSFFFSIMLYWFLRNIKSFFHCQFHNFLNTFLLSSHLNIFSINCSFYIIPNYKYEFAFRYMRSQKCKALDWWSLKGNKLVIGNIIWHQIFRVKRVGGLLSLRK